MKIRFVDDLSLAEKVNLDTQLDSLNSGNLILPPANSRLQIRLDELSLSSKYHYMKLNLQKTKLMIFNFSRKY